MADEVLYLHVWAPVLTAYAGWVLKNAEKAGLHRLYFLARDAWPVYIAAKAIGDQHFPGIECRYLKVSRYAMRLPQYHLLGEKCLDLICTGGIDVTLEKILRRGGLTDAEISAYAARTGRQESLKRILSYPEVMVLKGLLAADKELMEVIRRHSEAAYPAAMSYLAQEGLLDDTSCAVVDSGWIGTLQQSMQQLIRTEKPDKELEGYYFGLYELPDIRLKDRYHTWYFGPADHLSRKACFSNCLFETICSSPEGMTMGYMQSGAVCEAVSFPQENPNAGRLCRYNDLLKVYADHYSSCCDCERQEIPARSKHMDEAVKGLLTTLMGHPQAWEVDAFGSSLFSDDMLEGSMQQVAARLTEKEIKDQRLLNKAAIMLGLKKGELPGSAWIEGSIVRADKDVNISLAHARLYKYIVYLRKLRKNL